MLPRHRKVPYRYEVGEAPPEYLASGKDHYQKIYFDVIDLIIACIRDRFEQKGFQVPQKLETALTENQELQ